MHLSRLLQVARARLCAGTLLFLNDGARQGGSKTRRNENTQGARLGAWKAEEAGGGSKRRRKKASEQERESEKENERERGVWYKGGGEGE
eukprot:1921404-Rhodomonas_salina.1